MSNKLPKVPLTEWLTKREAATLLGLSEKSVDRMAERGEIQKATRKQNGKPPAVVFHPADIGRVKTERHQTPAPFIMPNGTAELQTLASSQQPAAAAELVRALTAIADRLAGPAEVKEPLWLTLAEASEASGLPPSYLRKHFLDTGRAVKTGRGWRIRRAELQDVGHVRQTSDTVREGRATR